MNEKHKSASPQAKTQDNATARQIVAAAKTLFLQRGYQAVTMREIAAKAEVNLGLLPYYFSAKDNLANHVYVVLTDEKYRSLLAQYPLTGASDAVRAYVYTVLTLEKADENFHRFYCEYLASCHGNESISNTFREMSERIIRAYHLPVQPAENEAYLVAMKGAERLLNIRRNQGKIDISIRQIFKIILSDYLYNLGLPETEIAHIIAEGTKTLDALA